MPSRSSIRPLITMNAGPIEHFELGHSRRGYASRDPPRHRCARRRTYRDPRGARLSRAVLSARGPLCQGRRRMDVRPRIAREAHDSGDWRRPWCSRIAMLEDTRMGLCSWPPLPGWRMFRRRSCWRSSPSAQPSAARIFADGATVERFGLGHLDRAGPKQLLLRA